MVDSSKMTCSASSTPTPWRAMCSKFSSSQISSSSQLRFIRIAAYHTCDTESGDDDLSYGDYVEQLTYLLFLRIADEQTRPPLNRESGILDGFDWSSLMKRDGDELGLSPQSCLTPALAFEA